MDNNSEWADRFRSLKHDSEIAIVGGSLTGPALLLRLRQAGFTNVRVFEATPSTVSQAGGVIRLGRRALGMLDSIGIGRGEAVPFPSERIVSVKIASRRETGRVDRLVPGNNTTWTLLHDLLVQRLPVGTLHTGKRVTGLGSDGTGRAMLQFADGEQVNADLVAFADGRRSYGRTALDPARPLRYSGHVAHRGQLNDCPDDIRDFVRFEPEESGFVTAPIRMRDGRIGLDWTFYKNTSPDRFRELFGADPTTRTFVLPHQVSDTARQEVDNEADRLLPPDVADLIKRTTTRMAAPIVDTAPPERMMTNIGDSAAVILGDALAPVHPLTASGLNNGINQVNDLVRALTAHRETGSPLGTVLARWQERHLQQVAAALERGPELAHAVGLGR